MHKDEKERVVTELTERLQSTPTLIVADYRGLTMPQIDDLRTELLKHGAKFTVVKNTLTRRAAEAAGSDALLALLASFPTILAAPTQVIVIETSLSEQVPKIYLDSLIAHGKNSPRMSIPDGGKCTYNSWRSMKMTFSS